MDAPGGIADVTVVVVTWNQRDLVLACLESLAQQTVACRVLVVDNASEDGTVAAVEAGYPDAEIVALTENTGFAGGVAAALPRVRTRFVALLNNDAIAEPSWLEASLARFGEPAVAAVAAKMLLLQEGDDRTPGSRLVNNAGVVLLHTGYGADRGLGDPDGDRLSVPADVFGFSGGAVVLRSLAVLAVGSVDPRWFMYYEDTDLAWRLRRAGWRIVYEPAAVVHHRHAASSDLRSEMFAYYNERNRLLTLARNAPPSVTVRAGGRFLVTTLSLAAKRLAGRPVPPDAVFRPALRLRVLAGTLMALPGLGRGRHWSSRRRSRRDVWAEWSGVPSRPEGRRPTRTAS
jgi:GT2 family glycosyltransferase